MNESIPLSQKLYALGIHPQKGGLVIGAASAMDYVLVGALFLELYQAGNIKFEDKKIVVLNSKSEIPIHHFMLDKLSKSKKSMKISRWINKFYYSMKHIRNEVRDGLSDKRIIRMKSKRFLFFKWKIPVIVSKQYIYHLVDYVNTMIFKGTTDENELIFLSFIEPAGLLRRVFKDREKRRQAKKNLKKMMAENQVSKAVSDAIVAAQAVAASVAASVAATSAASS